MIFFSKFANLPRLMIYQIIRIQQITYKKQTICEACPRRQISRSGYLQLQLQLSSLELFTHNLKTKQHLAIPLLFIQDILAQRNR